MESLFDALYAFAMENRFDLYALQDGEERRENELMIRRALEDLDSQGAGDLAERISDGYAALSFLDRRGAFRAGLSMGLELVRL